MTAISTTQVNGRIALADNVSLANGAIEFVLTGYDTDQESGATIVPQTVSAAVDANGDIDISLWPNADGNRSTQYRVTAIAPGTPRSARYDLGLITVPEDGPVDLNDLLSTEVDLSTDTLIMTPAEFGDVTTDSTAAIKAMFAYCVPRNIKMMVAGEHNMSGTLAPNGPYHCEWVNARLTWIGDDVTVLTEVMENASGDTYTGTGKYVLFDTSGCEGAYNGGRLEIWGSTIGNARRSSLAAIPTGLIALTAATAQSPNITWGQIMIRGCDDAMYQGNMSGTAAPILPYTGWVVDWLEIKFCKNTYTPGVEGNGFDECVFTNVRLSRNGNNGLARTDFGSARLFAKGKRMPAQGSASQLDSETFKATTTAGNTSVSFDAAHGLSVGDVVAINEASENLDASSALIHVSRVESVTDTTTVVIETAPLRSGSALNVVLNPPSFEIYGGDVIFAHMYFEEVHDVALGIGDGGRVFCQDLKYSNGDFASRGNFGAHFIGASNMSMDVTINRVSGINNEELRYLVGVPAILSGSNAPGIQADIALRGYIRGQFTKFKPFGVYSPETDMRGSYTAAAGAPSVPTMTLRADYANQTTWHQAGALGDAQEMLYDNGYDILSFGSNLRGAEDLTGVSTDGADVSGPTAGVVTKVAGAAGYFWEDISVTAGDRLRIDYDATVTARGFTVQLYNSGGGGTPAGNVTESGSPIRQTSASVIFIDVPSGTDRIGVAFAATAAGTVSKFIVRKLET